MNNTVKNSETENVGKFENIKQLNTLNQPGSGVSILLDNVKEARRRLDNLLNTQREKERERELIKERERSAVKEEIALKQKPIAPGPSQINGQNIMEVIPIVKEQPVVQATETVQAPVVVETKQTVAAKPVEKPPQQPKPAATTTTTPRPKTSSQPSLIREKQIDNTPSYIRGKYVPTPPPVAKPAAPRFSPSNQGGFNRQQKTGDYSRPMNRPAGGTNDFRRPSPSGAPFGGGTFTPSTGIRKPLAPKLDALPGIAKERNKTFDKKKEYVKPGDDKKSMNKRTLIRKGFIQDDLDDERMGTRKLKNKRIKEQIVFAPIKIEKAIITTENLTVKILSEKIGKTAQEIIKQLMVLGIMTTINSVVDFPTMELVANELGVELELKLEKTKEEELEEEHDEVDNDLDLSKRPPIITVMGHVDHGKTSLLDAIRKTTVVSGEAGGITQHIGAYSVVCRNEKITFLDTPGHEAFTAMRARGASVTDIAILVVAADDGVMPQTVEAINHAKAANVPIIVAINKIDKPTANIDKIKQDLMKYNLVPEEWGGDVMMVPISAKNGVGIDKLLETILFLAEYNGYKANAKRSAKATVIEAKLDKGKGAVANVIIQNGTLYVGDYVVSGTTCGRVRGLVDDKGRSIKEAGPSTPVSVLGFTDVPSAGDKLFVVSDEKMAKQVVAERNAKIKSEAVTEGQKITLDDVLNKTNVGQKKDLNIVIKADVQGSAEALKTSLMKLETPEVKVNVIHSAVGAINKSDLMLADVSDAILVGFNVRPDSESKTLAEQNGTDIRLYRVIYEALDDIERKMKGMEAPRYREVIMGRAQIRNVIKVSSAGIIAGSYVTSGKITRNSKVRVFRNGEIVFTGEIKTLKRFKDDVKEVSEGYECGISINDFTDMVELDEIEAFILEREN